MIKLIGENFTPKIEFLTDTDNFFHLSSFINNFLFYSML